MKRSAGSPRVLAHRGDHRIERENTIAAFEAAFHAGAHGIECDVRAAGDGTLVVHHDATLRLRGRRRRVADLGRGTVPPWMPTLQVLLAWAKRRPSMLLNLELKEPGLEDDVLRLVRARRLLPRIVVTSFHPDVCFQIREKAPTVPTGFLTEEERHLRAAVAVANEAGARMLVIRRRAATTDAVGLIHDAGLVTWVWGVNRVHDATQLARLGVEALITDRVDRLQRAFAPPPTRRPPTGRSRDRDR